MRYRCADAFVLMLLLFTTACAEQRSVTDQAVYRGAWFTVRYPADFRAKPSMKSSTADGYDSVFFHSPDGRVSFYIYAPQWGGKPTDITLTESSDRQVTKRVSKGPARTVTWYTVTTGAYTAHYQQTDSNDGTSRWIIGLRYATPADFAAYRQAYEKFKRSLVLAAD